MIGCPYQIWPHLVIAKSNSLQSSLIYYLNNIQNFSYDKSRYLTIMSICFMFQIDWFSKSISDHFFPMVLVDLKIFIVPNQSPPSSIQGRIPYGLYDFLSLFCQNGLVCKDDFLKAKLIGLPYQYFGHYYL